MNPLFIYRGWTIEQINSKSYKFYHEDEPDKVETRNSLEACQKEIDIIRHDQAEYRKAQQK